MIQTKDMAEVATRAVTKEQQNMKTLEWRQRNRDKIREYNRTNYQKHKATIQAHRRLRNEYAICE
jgi:post-segregation antitoxin (ccd killing protein)